MPFKDLKEGTTHSYNDGCGCPEHNSMEKENTTGKFIIIRYPDSCDCSIERFDTLEELEKAVKEDSSCSPQIIACKEIEQKLVLEEDLT